jgi:hypothetical protein
MPLYRILQRISKGGSVGDIVPCYTWPGEHREKLEEVGAIAMIATPPLSELPGWEERATLLEIEGVLMLDEFVCTDAKILASILSATAGEIEQWKKELLSFVKA